MAPNEKSGKESFLHKILRENSITQEKLFDHIKEFITKISEEKKGEKFLKTFNLKNCEQEKSLYRRAEKYGLMESKI